MNGWKRFLALWTTAALLVAVCPPVVCGEAAGELEAANPDEEYKALSMWLSETEGTVNLYDREDNPIEPEEDMRMDGGTVLETEEESLAVVDMDRERLAIMDQTSRAGFEKTDHGDQISITLLNGAMYFRVGIPLEEEESFEVVMDNIVLAIRGTCGMVQQSEEDGLSIVLASGHAAISKVPEAAEEGTEAENGEAEPEEIEIEAGEQISVTVEETEGRVSFEKKKLTEEEVPAFLVEALKKDPEQLEKVYEETGWEAEKLFPDGIPTLGSEQSDEVMDYYQVIIREAERYDFFDYGEGIGKYQYAIVYLDEDTIPTLLLAEETNDMYRYLKFFHYDPEQHLTIESMTSLSEYHSAYYTRSGNRGLLQWYADGAYAYGIVEIYIENGEYKSKAVWYEENYDKAWPANLPYEEIQWTDIP